MVFALSPRSPPRSEISPRHVARILSPPPVCHLSHHCIVFSSLFISFSFFTGTDSRKSGYLRCSASASIVYLLHGNYGSSLCTFFVVSSAIFQVDSIPPQCTLTLYTHNTTITTTTTSQHTSLMTPRIQLTNCPCFPNNGPAFFSLFRYPLLRLLLVPHPMFWLLLPLFSSLYNRWISGP